MRKYLIILSVITLSLAFFSACDKDDNPSDNTNNGTTNNGNNTHTPEAFLKITNICKHPFTIYVDNIPNNTCYGNSTKTISVNPGSRAIKVVQNSGYYIYPLTTMYEATTFIDGETKTITIPDISTGKIKIISGSSNPYSLYVNNEYEGTIAGNGSKTITVDAWKPYDVRVIQNSGYILYPSEFTHTYYVDANYIYSWTFDSKSAENNGSNENEGMEIERKDKEQVIYIE